MALTKAALIENLQATLGFSRTEARTIVESFFETISATLVKEGSVKLAGFGNFVVRHKRERPGRNPHTGEIIPVSARRVVTFKAGQKLRQRIKDNSA